MKIQPVFYFKKLIYRIILFGLFCIGSSILVQGQTTTSWNGDAGDGEFTTDSNWTSSAPGTSTAATIDTAGTLDIDLSSSDEIGSLFTTGTGTINLNLNANTLTLDGASYSAALYVDGGSTFSLSGSSGSGVNVQTGQIFVGDTTGNGTLDIATSLNLDGENSGANYAYLVVGRNDTTNYLTFGTSSTGTGIVNQTAGTVTTGGAFVVGVDEGTGIYNLSGGTLTTGTTGVVIPIYIGLNQTSNDTTPANGTLNITGTGTFNMQPDGSLYVGAGINAASQGDDATSGGTGTIVQNGAGTLVTIGGHGAQFGYFADTSGTGTGGTGTYDLDAGTLNVIAGSFSFGSSAGGTGYLNQTGGTFTSAVDVIIGDSGTGTYTLSDGTAILNGGLLIANAAGSTGEVDLDGGTLEIGGANGISQGSGTATLNLGGGTIQVIGSALTTGVAANLVDDTTSIIDTNGLGATFTGAITGATGQLVKIGSGDLALNNANNTIGSFLVAGGNVNQSAGNTLTTSELAVGTGAGDTASYTMSGGSLVFTTGAPPPIVGATATASSFRVGDFGGTGTFTQTDGSVSVNGAMDIGNQGGTGTYDISGGTLDLSGGGGGITGLYQLGRTTSSSTAASTGTLNISSTGAVTVSNGNFIVGNQNQNAGGYQGTGTVTQSGGTFTVDSGAGLFLSGYGTGNVYDLDGGTLQVGGDSLQAQYTGDGASSGTYEFNLGGGTIQVIGSALTTGVAANLVDDTTSIIDTNGLGATFTGAITGATGQLVKIGLGDLALNNANNTIGSFLVAAGNVDQTTGSTLTTSELAVGTGAGDTASYTMSGGSLVFTTGAPPDIVGGTASSFRVGDFGGTGTFTQTGGSVDVNGAMDIGNRGGNGTYDISSGSLTLEALLNVIGRNDPADGASGTYSDLGSSQGALNISGSANVSVADGAELVLGSNTATTVTSVAQGSKGTIVQSGGVFQIQDGGTLYLSAVGQGEFDLDGGIFEVGGNGLVGNYNDLGGSYQFNLGGGTIQVDGSDLTTDVAATLVSSTTSIIDTNGFNATWSGALTGSGNLTEIGAGTLTTSNINSTGEFDLQNGTWISSGTSNAIGQLFVDGGNTANLQVGTGQSLTITPVGTTTAGRIYENSTLNLSGGGTVNIDGSFAVGRNSVANPGDPSSGTLNITGSTQVNLDYSDYTNLFVGAGTGVAGTQGTVNQQDTSTVTLGSNLIIGADNATAIYNLSDNAILTTSASPEGFIYVGFNQDSADTAGTTSGILNILGNSTFTVGQGSQLRVGAGDNRSADGDDANYGATGEIIQNGAGSVVTLDTGTGGAWFGTLLTDSSGSITGGSGTYELDAGTLDLQSGTVSFGDSAGASGYLNQTGGTLTAATDVTIGNSGAGTYNMSGGTASFGSGLIIGNNTGSQGTVNQTGGTVGLTGGALNLKQSNSVYYLYGGTFTVGGSGVTGSGSLNVGSGDLNTGTGTITGTGGTLAGNGLVNVATVVSNNGILAPGSTTSDIHSPGELTFSNLTLNSGSTYAWNLASETTTGGGSNFDVINAAANGSIVFTGVLTLNLSFAASINFSDSFWDSSETWTILDATATDASLTGDAAISITSSSSPSYASAGSFSTSQDGNEVQLTWTPQAAPEPSTWTLLLGGLGLLAFWRLRNPRRHDLI